MQEGNAALARRDYAVAEVAAREVLAGGRNASRAGDAQFLLAQALVGRRDYQGAAVAYDDAYNRSRTGSRAPEALLGLANALAGLNAVCALLRLSLPEREPHAVLYPATIALLDDLEAGADWPARYLRWEVLLLEELGFGLDLSCCAVTGDTTDLAFVSPRTGRAVSRDGAGDWADRLMPLPACLMGQGPASPAELAQGLAITGHFLARELAPVLNDRPLPEARARLVDMLGR